MDWDKEVAKIDTEDLITEIEKSPAIWNSTSDEYSDRIAKRNSWNRVITNFFHDFEDKLPAEKKSLGNIFQRRWKSLRDGYSRENLKRKSEQRSGSAATGRKCYVYYEQLKFLEPLTKTTKTSLSDGGENTEDTDVSILQQPEEITRPPAQRRKTGTKTTQNDSEDKILMQNLKTQILQNNVNANDEDRLFMLSLVSELKKVPDYMKLDVKTRLMGVFSQVRHEVQRMNEIQHPSQQQPYYNNYSAPRPGFSSDFQGFNARPTMPSHMPPQMPHGSQDTMGAQVLQFSAPPRLTLYPSGPSSAAEPMISPTDTYSSSASSEIDFSTL